MTFTLPEPAGTTVKSGKYGPFNQVKREAETRWVLSPEGAEKKVVVEVTTRHDVDSKVFRSTCTWGEIESRPAHPADGGGVFSVFSWSSDHAYVLLSREPVARYSKKALEEQHAYILSVIAEQPEHVERVFAEAQAAVPTTEEV